MGYQPSPVHGARVEPQAHLHDQHFLNRTPTKKDPRTTNNPVSLTASKPRTPSDKRQHAAETLALVSLHEALISGDVRQSQLPIAGWRRALTPARSPPCPAPESRSNTLITPDSSQPVTRTGSRGHEQKIIAHDGPRVVFWNRDDGAILFDSQATPVVRNVYSSPLPRVLAIYERSLLVQYTLGGGSARNVRATRSTSLPQTPRAQTLIRYADHL